MPYTAVPYPGKFEGNPSQWVAEVLYSLCGISAYSDCFGSVEDVGWHAIIDGKQHTWIVIEDGQGFFDYMEFDDVVEAYDVWDDMTTQYSEWTGSEQEE